MKGDDGKHKISRRAALKYMGIGAAAIPASFYLNSCGKKIKTDQIVPDLTNIPTDKMTYRTLSKAGDRISLLGFGPMRYPAVERETPEGVRRFIDEEKAEQLIDYAMAHGINYYDTAWMYHQ